MILGLIIDIVTFSVLIAALCFFKEKIYNFFINIGNKTKPDSEKWMPLEQLREFKQLFYLLFAGLLIVDLYYLIIINTSANYIWTCVIFDFIVSLLAGMYVYDKEHKLRSFIILITLVPFTGYSVTGYMAGFNWFVFIILEFIHSIGIIYVFIRSIIDFRSYSESNKLGYTILLLYIIVFICVYLSTLAEGLSLLDSLVYCSNAFTSNGYGLVDATDNLSKIISLVLVWSGYILSGVSTALLTLAVISRYYKKRFVNLKTRIQNQNAQLKEINEKLDILLENS